MKVPKHLWIVLLNINGRIGVMVDNDDDAAIRAFRDATSAKLPFMHSRDLISVSNMIMVGELNPKVMKVPNDAKWINEELFPEKRQVYSYSGIAVSRVKMLLVKEEARHYYEEAEPV